MMGEIMQFPETVEEFMQQYKITDTQQVYTNGTEFVPIFRMKQWFEAHKQRWIPCSERLPETDGPYLAANKTTGWIGVYNFSRVKNFPYFGPQENAWWRLDDDWYPQSCNVTNWMPLPEPPEDEQNGRT